MEATSDKLILGQDVYFLGYPFGKFSEVFGMNRGLPIPFVKKGIVSALHAKTPGNEILWIDGHNISGFSGGPVVIVHKDLDYKVAGVISGYKLYYENIRLKDEVIPETYVSLNSGLIVAYPIDHALEIIKNHPFGTLLS